MRCFDAALDGGWTADCGFSTLSAEIAEKMGEPRQTVLLGCRSRVVREKQFQILEDERLSIFLWLETRLIRFQRMGVVVGKQDKTCLVPTIPLNRPLNRPRNFASTHQLHPDFTELPKHSAVTQFQT